MPTRAEPPAVDGGVVALARLIQTNRDEVITRCMRDHGDVCQTVTSLAIERNVDISAEEFRTAPSVSVTLRGALEPRAKGVEWGGRRQQACHTSAETGRKNCIATQGLHLETRKITPGPA